MPQLETVHVKATLTGVAVAYFQGLEGFIADLLAPQVKSPKQSDYYYIFGNEHFDVVQAVRRPGDTPVEVEHTVSTDQYYCREYAMREKVPDEERENADSPIEPEADAVLYTSERLRLSKEARVAAELTNANNYQSGFKVTLSGDDQFDKYETSDPIGVIQTAIDAISAAGKAPNTMWMGYEVWSKLKHHPALIARLEDNSTRIVTTELFKKLFEELETVAIGRALYNTAAEGHAQALGQVWGKYLGLSYVNRTLPNKKVPSFCYMFTWPYSIQQGRVRTGNQPGSANGTIYQARTYRHADEGAKSDWVEVALREGFKITAPKMGYLVSGAVA